MKVNEEQEHSGGDSLGAALNGLREMFPGVQIIVGIRDCGNETVTPRGQTLEYFAQIGLNGEDFEADSPSGLVATVRKWKVRQFAAAHPTSRSEKRRPIKVRQKNAFSVFRR